VRPLVLDLFAGCGGFSLGFEQAGFDIAGCVEIDPIHCLTHHFNFPYSTVVQSDITKLPSAEITRRIGPDIDIIIGGAPCQGFSLIGKRNFEDQRNQLVREFLRVIRDIRPKFFVFENVKGITLGKHKSFVRELIEEAEKIGYKTASPYRVLDARNYSVPQARKRFILMGARIDQPVPSYPCFVTSPSIDSGEDENTLLPTPTCSEVLDDIPNADNYDELLTSDSVMVGSWPEAYSALLRYYRPSHDRDWIYGHKRDWNKQFLTSSARTRHTSISTSRFMSTAAGEVEPHSRFYKLEANGYSNTLRAGTDSSRGAFTSPRPIHYQHARCVTVREMARLHGYPDWFRFHVTKWHGARQIGNSVPPPMARAIASAIIEAMDYKPTTSKVQMELGCAEWLSYDMSQASSYFGVSSPISGRTLKGSYRKPKQIQAA
jgi:DNA (cytosine-5)-methyltransferase 1